MQRSVYVGALALLFGISTSFGSDPNTNIPVTGYKLFWSDEFNGTTLDTNKWSYRHLGSRKAAINVEDTVSLDGKGNLILTTKRVNDEIHTAMIGTQGKFDTTYGYFECRVKMQGTDGNRSAFWLQTTKQLDAGLDPREFGTEIDIYECFYVKSHLAFHNLHWNGYGKKHLHVGSGAKKIPNISEGYHTFGVEWTPKKYRFFIDGRETWRSNKAVSGTDEYIILSMEVVKKQAKMIMAKPEFADHVYFDYVRVYKKPDE